MFYKKVSLKISQNSQGNTRVGVSFLVNYIKNQDSDTGVFLCEINFNFIGNHLIKNRYNNGPLNVENFARSVFSLEWQGGTLNTTTCMRASPESHNLVLCFNAFFVTY